MYVKMRLGRSPCFSGSFTVGRFRTFFADVISPFLIGFCAVLLLFFLRELFDDPNTIEQRQAFENRHIPVHHHGLRIGDFPGRVNSFSLESEGSGTRTWVAFPKGKSRHGGIWSWPEVEKKQKPLSSSVVWVVTPTYKDPYQYAELTRLAQAMYPARKLIRWLIIMDGYKKSESQHNDDKRKLRNYLNQFGIHFNLIQTTTRSLNTNLKRRRAALQLIRKLRLIGTIHLADAENTYDSDIFRQMQGTKKLSIWPTGAISEWLVNSPILNHEGNVVDFFHSGSITRRFPADFSSFAFNSSLLLPQKSNTAGVWVRGNEKTIFIRSLNVSIDEFQPLAAEATEVLMWHTRTIHSKAYKNNSTR